jgi:ADP-ribose pyrophosphatase YjhB (NUDIX family)
MPMAAAAAVPASAENPSKMGATTSTRAFQGRIDRFNGITIDLSTELSDSSLALESFRARLLQSLAEYAKRGLRGVWVRVPPAHAHLIGCMLSLGFEYHHARETTALLVLWLPDFDFSPDSSAIARKSGSSTSRLPHYASTQLGVGGLVLSNTREVLLIREKYHLDAEFWKLPGGLVDRRESLLDAAAREVLEETGVQARFVSIVAFRHALSFSYDTGDIYFICLMRPLDESAAKQLRPQPEEISDAKWAPLDEWLASPSTAFWSEQMREAVRAEADATLRFELQIAANVPDAFQRAAAAVEACGSTSDLARKGPSDLDKLQAMLDKENAALAAAPAPAASGATGATPPAPPASATGATGPAPVAQAALATAAKGRIPRISPLGWRVRYSHPYAAANNPLSSSALPLLGVTPLIAYNETLGTRSLYYVANAAAASAAAAAKAAAAATEEAAEKDANNSSAAATVSKI